MHFLEKLLAFVFLLFLFSCESVKRKGDVIVDKTKHTVTQTKQEISEKKHELVDKILPTYDDGTPDTRDNRKRFKEHLQIELTDDIRDIYAFGDFMGIDYKVLISFSCEQAAIDRIVNIKSMQPSGVKDEGLLFAAEFKWWDKDKIGQLLPFKKGEPGKYWEYLWYDPKTKRAFYEEFSL